MDTITSSWRSKYFFIANVDEIVNFPLKGSGRFAPVLDNWVQCPFH